MNILDFDPSLSDSAKLASIARSAKAAMDYAEGAMERADALGDVAAYKEMHMYWAGRCGILEAAVDVLCVYIASIATQAKGEGLDYWDEAQDDWYDANGNVDPKGAYDAAGHHFAERDGRIGCDF